MKLEFVTYENLLKGENKYSIKMIQDIFLELISNLKLFVSEFDESFIKKHPNIEFKPLVLLDEGKAIQAVLEALDDLKRLKDFHPVKNPNRIKYASYIAYWWLQRKPITVNIDGLNLADAEEIYLTNFNECFLVTYVLNELFDRDTVVCCCDKDKIKLFDKEWQDLQNYLFYFFCYRTNSAKTIEALLKGAILHPIWMRNRDVSVS